MSATTAAIADAGERALAIDPTRSFIVQAPAGSGKTELLIQRFLALLATVRRPDEILAITFTRKAAGEMRSRLLLALQGADGPQPVSEHAHLTWTLARRALEQDRRHGWDLLENPSLLTIQTIDSFDAALVRRMPWVSRFGALPQVAEDPEALYRRAAERTLASLGSGRRGDSEAEQLLTHLDNRMDLLRDLLVRMLARRDQWLRHMVWEDHAEQRRRLEDALGGFIEQALAAVQSAFPVDLRDELLALGRYAAANLDGGERPLHALAAVTTFPGTAVADLSAWLGFADLLLTSAGTLRRRLDKNGGFPAGKGEAAAMKDRMQRVFDALDPGAERLLEALRHLPAAAYPEEQWRILQALVELLPLAAAELWLVFRQEGVTDFAAIALQAMAALGSVDSPSELLLKLDARLSHILVDEFQDTSYLQFGLLEHLTAGWGPGDGRTLFAVGDPMQSIYLFREAEVGLFLRARSRGIGAVSLEPLTLSANFRSQQGVVDWVNGSFAGVFPESEDEALGGVIYSPATSVHPPLEGDACTVHPSSGRDDRAEALEIVSLAHRTLEECPGETVAVLVRSRTHLPEILRAFREAGLRFAAKDIDVLGSRPVVRDLLALTRSLLHPGDRLAWLAVLRAPWCGLLLDDLYALCADGARTVPDLLSDPAVTDRLSDDGRERAERAWAVLSRGMRRRGAVSLRRLVEGCWLALGGPSCAGQGGGEDAATVFGLMERLDCGGDLRSLDLLEEGVGKLFAAPDSGADGRLQVMTIHKSKGLEFDHVILPGLGRLPAGGDRPLLRWLEHPECGLLLAPLAPRDGSARDPIYDAIGHLERAKEDLEVSRLLYVASTRAKKRLHLFGHAALNSKGECVPAAGSLLKKLWPVVQGHYAFESEQGRAEPPEEEGGQALRRLPLSWRLPEMGPAPVSTASGQIVERRTVDDGGAFSGWEAEAARHVGTVTHAYLERIARDGLDKWPSARVGEVGGGIRRRLTALGVPAGELSARGETVARALRTAIEGERGRWILGDRVEAECELELSGLVDGEVQHKVLDRTFVDDGVRWIVDYKSSEPQQGEMSSFLADERERYRAQLVAYAALIRGMGEGRPIRAALYFPLFDGWCEVPVGWSEVGGGEGGAGEV